MNASRISLSDFTIGDLLAVSPGNLRTGTLEDSVVTAASQLKSFDVPGVIMTDERGSVRGLVGGHNILMLLAAGPFDPYVSLYHVKAHVLTWPVLTCKANDALGGILKEMKKRGRGHAVVTGNNGEPTNVIGLLDLARFFLKSKVAAQLEDVVLNRESMSPVTGITKTTSISHSVSIMINKHFRRLFISESQLVLSDRSIIRWLLDQRIVDRLQRRMEVLDVPVTDASEFAHKPQTIKQNTGLISALSMMVENDGHCLLTENYDLIATPQDLTLGLI